MGTIAPLALIVPALFLLGSMVVVVLCLRASRRGESFEGEIKAASFGLRLKTDPAARENSRLLARDAESRSLSSGAKTTHDSTGAAAAVPDHPS
jgi:hypothetical protein